MGISFCNVLLECCSQLLKWKLNLPLPGKMISMTKSCRESNDRNLNVKLFCCYQLCLNQRINLFISLLTAHSSEDFSSQNPSFYYYLNPIKIVLKWFYRYPQQEKDWEIWIMLFLCHSVLALSILLRKNNL